MTPLSLFEALEEYLQDKLKDMVIESRTESGTLNEKSAIPNVYLFHTPTMRPRDKEIMPYVMLFLDSGKDTIPQGAGPAAECTVAMVVACYGKDKTESYKQALNIINQIRFSFISERRIANRYQVKALDYRMYTDSEDPRITIGDISVTFDLPPIEQNPPKFLQNM